MWTATEARAMTKNAIEHLDDYYMREYRSLIANDIEEAIKAGFWQSSTTITIMEGDIHKDKQEKGLVRLVGILTNMYGYKVTAEEHDEMYWKDIEVTVSWSDDAVK